jgi:hypothetical protein
MKTFHNYLIPSLLSPIRLHGHESSFHNWIFIIWLDSTQHIYENKFNSNWFEFNQFVLNWIWFSSTIFNSIEISTKTLIMLNPKERKYCVQFNSLQFKNLDSIQLNLKSIECGFNFIIWIQFKLHYANSLDIKSFKWNLI